jgi:hypothetical protein
MAKKQLSEIVTKDRPDILNVLYREPTITAYNRLEARPRAINFERSLRAEIRDSLWMLTRQWQMGEYEAEDAGSAIEAKLMTRNAHIDLVVFPDGKSQSYNDLIPMEVMVERETVPFTLALKVQTAQMFLKLHSNLLKDKYLVKYRSVYAIDPAFKDILDGQADSLNLWLATARRMLDGERLLQDIQDNQFKTKVGIDAADESEIDSIILKFLEWMDRQLSQPGKDINSAWNTEALTYQFSVSAPESGDRRINLDAPQYHQGRLDWYNFEHNLKGIIPSAESGAGIVAEDEIISVIPTRSSFKGMPNPRFWEMEERLINLGKLNAKTTDHMLMLLAEYGLIYANDWMVIPYKIPVNTLCEIKGLVVTDVFGDRTLIRRGNENKESDWQRWSMFNLSHRGNMSAYSHQLFLPSTLQDTQESEPLEQVNYIRDEMANMVWGIEETISDATSRGINAIELAAKNRIELERVSESQAEIQYVLGTPVPQNWIPFIPVQVPGSIQDIRYLRANMPRLGSPPVDVIKPLGVLLNEVPAPYYINEEEIPYAGTIVRRTWQRTRWYNGKTYVWIGRYRETGRGQGSSGLQFDQIISIAKT